jgi:hypothetical protein
VNKLYQKQKEKSTGIVYINCHKKGKKKGLGRQNPNP